MSRRRLKLELLEERIIPTLGVGFVTGGAPASSNYVTESDAIAVDSAGNSYITGYFEAQADFGSVVLHAQGMTDAFVAKFNSAGAVVWAKDLGGASDSVQGRSIAVDSSGDVYSTGFFSGTNINFGGAPISSSHSGGDINTYVLKLDPSGNFVFDAVLGYGSRDTQSNGIAVDSAGNVYTTGYFQGVDVNFDPTGSGTADAGSSQAGGDPNAFVSKLTATGQFGFIAVLGFDTTLSESSGEAIAVDGAGNVYIAGYFDGADLNFDPTGSGPDNASTSHGGTDYNAFVSRLTSSGGFESLAVLGYGSKDAQAYGIAVDGSGNVYVTGLFKGAGVNFDPIGSGTANAASSHGGSDYNAFVTKLTASNQFGYLAVLGYGSTEAWGDAIAVDADGNVYSTGYFSGANINFDPIGSGPDDLTSSHAGSDQNAYVSLLNSSGQFTADGVLGYGGTVANGTGIGVDSSGNYYVSGYFRGLTSNFDPTGSGSDNLSSSVNGTFEDLFLEKLTQNIQMASTYTNLAYIDSYLAYANGTGSYNAFLYEYTAYYYASNAQTYAAAGNLSAAESCAYYAYYYGYYGSKYADQDYVNSGNNSTYSYDAYAFGYYGWNYSYDAAAGM